MKLSECVFFLFVFVGWNCEGNKYSSCVSHLTVDEFSNNFFATTNRARKKYKNYTKKENINVLKTTKKQKKKLVKIKIYIHRNREIYKIFVKKEKFASV